MGVVNNSGLIGVIILIALSGCANNDFTCSEYPDTGCQPMSHAYQESNSSNFQDYRSSFYSSTAGQVQKAKSKVVIDRTYNVLQSVYEGDAVLTRPKQMRIMVNHFVTENDALVTGAVMFIKTAESQWLLEGGVNEK
ncbi:hypothetical protein [uncultured Microbulbifer sp.]|uniref:hypothetical protein n=1 Tax=uncultured Microbulbifer sp. TaxID=348147 RepID=UPI002628BDD6|nr:hypothetical protein [uncultured Microbulbifer sp.]